MTKLFKSIFFSILIISNVNAEDIVTDKSMKVAVGLGAGYWLFPVRFEYSFQFFDCLELAGYATPPVGNIESIANQAIDMFISYGSIVYLNTSGITSFFIQYDNFYLATTDFKPLKTIGYLIGLDWDVGEERSTYIQFGAGFFTGTSVEYSHSSQTEEVNFSGETKETGSYWKETSTIVSPMITFGVGHEF